MALATRAEAALRPILAAQVLYRLALLGLCAAYIQGGFNKAMDFTGAKAEMIHFGLVPEAPFALAVIVLELGASLLVLWGKGRWLGALALAGFTLVATLMANRYWEVEGPERFMLANAFYEHLGLVGGFLLVVWVDWTGRSERVGQ
ncbi:DoxX family protein [Zavarzinia sp. CC-PAN008]|uniref:DoxX family protein n=1 Tax=Zavarzinia sp. CC-PAN008 TaxID=3243332 RepID=UPI003F748D50